MLEVDPGNIDALHFLGVVAFQRKEYERAVELISDALSRDAANAPAHNNLGNVLKEQGELEDAIACYQRAVTLQPGYLDAHINLGAAFRARGDLDDAVASYQWALTLAPDAPAVCFNLGNISAEQGKFDEAERYYRKALALQPDLPEAHCNLGNSLADRGRLGEAVASYRKALAIAPDFADAHYNLGNALKDSGELEQALGSYRQAVTLAPDHAQAHANLVCALNYIPGLRSADIYAEHLDFARRFCPRGAPRRYRNIADPARELRIGYVSGDFRKHPVAQFIEPVLEQHDRSRFEIFCYYSFPRSDDVTERLRSRVGEWRDVFALSDDMLVELIHDDRIDILVDLSGYTAHHRLPVFGRKPAPVQATWLGYLNTTGLGTVDYRITDRYAAPEGLLEAYHSERLLRLTDSQWCYCPPPDCPEVSVPPSAGNGFVTFAAFSNLAKIGPPVMELWSRLLARVAGSRLLIVGAGLSSIHDEYLARLARCGVAADRVELRDFMTFQDYLGLHRAVDVMLDTFPYCGGTTTCHALWMGVPVVSLVGDTAPSRGGASVLNVIGLGELVAETPEEYLEIASDLATHPARLAALRSGMRARMTASALMDAGRFTRNLENAFGYMWRTWCGKK